MNVRRALSADSPQLCALLARYFEEWSVVQRDSPDAVRACLDMPSPYGFMVAEQEGGQPVGCVLLRPLANVSHAAECKRLYVLPENRGGGAASRMMEAAEAGAAAAGLGWLYLDSMPEFASAVAMYRRRGYTDCPRFNDNPQATIFLRKHLRGHNQAARCAVKMPDSRARCRR